MSAGHFLSLFFCRVYSRRPATLSQDKQSSGRLQQAQAPPPAYSSFSCLSCRRVPSQACLNWRRLDSGDAFSQRWSGRREAVSPPTSKLPTVFFFMSTEVAPDSETSVPHCYSQCMRRTSIHSRNPVFVPAVCCPPFPLPCPLSEKRQHSKHPFVLFCNAS